MPTNRSCPATTTVFPCGSVLPPASCRGTPVFHILLHIGNVHPSHSPRECVEIGIEGLIHQHIRIRRRACRRRSRCGRRCRRVLPPPSRLKVRVPQTVRQGVDIFLRDGLPLPQNEFPDALRPQIPPTGHQRPSGRNRVVRLDRLLLHFPAFRDGFHIRMGLVEIRIGFGT